MTAGYSTHLVTAVARDGEWVEGVLHTPKTGFSKTKPAVLMVHGAFGNFYTGVGRALGPRLASVGYPAMAINTRYHDYFEMDMIFEKEAKDIAAAVKFLGRKGARKVVLLGHSLGVPRVVHYVATANDHLVKGLILVSGPAAMSKWSEMVWGKKTIQKFLSKARAEAARDPYHIMSIVQGGEKIRTKFEWYHPVMPAIVARRTMTARALVDLMRPDAKADTVDYSGKVKEPILIVQGTKDGIVPPKDAETIKKAFPHGKLAYVKGAGHYFKGDEARLTRTITSWLRLL